MIKIKKIGAAIMCIPMTLGIYPVFASYATQMTHEELALDTIGGGVK